MSRYLSLLLLSLAGAASAAATPAASVSALDAYLSGLHTLRAEFTQVVTDGRGAEVQRARGSFVIQRPGKFRWELTPEAAKGANAAAPSAPSPQLMVADGKNLRFYDRDLEQVSVRSAASALTATPASLLSGDGKFGDAFTVQPDGKRDGLDWVKVTPRQSDADFREAELAFRDSGAELKRMVLKDKLGQTVKLDFVSSARNAPVAESEVSFTPPPGADVIGTPLP
jgi:outer membrane lipoprotein carrier protein